VNPATSRSLVPPRPNLGPEPWSEPAPIALYSVLAGTLAGLLVAWLVWRRLGSARARRAVSDLSSQVPPDTSPRGRLIGLSQSTRDVLARQFGPGWRAKTNEELSAEPRLAELLGHDQLQEFIQILNNIDLIKFAPSRINDHQESFEQQLAAWEPRLAELGKKIQARPERRPKNGSVRSSSRNSPLDSSHVASASTINN
jgi:hypothetical protein